MLSQFRQLCDFICSGDVPTDLRAEIKPRRTPPDVTDVLLLRPTAKFTVSLEYLVDESYCGSIQFHTPDPFEVRNQGRPKFTEWDYQNQILEINGFSGEEDILMKVVLPEKYRGEKTSCVTVTESSTACVLCRCIMKSDPPLHRT